MKGKKSPSKEVIMEILSREYGWLPSQIRNEKKQDIENYVRIIAIRNIIEKNNAKKYATN